MNGVCVLGGGLVGRFVANTLFERGHRMRLVDSDSSAFTDIPKEIECVHTRIDLEEGLEKIVGNCKIVVNCLPGRIGHLVRAPLLSIDGLSVADLAFTAEDPRVLDELARKHTSQLIFDVGIAPGLSNIIIGDAQHRIGKLERARIWVGGNPQKSDTDWSYMAPFSPSDVIEEYTRPARIRRNGTIITAPALTERHAVDVPEFGRMEAFLTDGLRSLLDTIDCDDVAEYTVRWPGHIQRFIDLETIDEKALIDAWRFDGNRPEFTWLAVEVDSDGNTNRWDLIDKGKDGWSSMARTTGLVTVEVVEMMAEGVLNTDGVHPPEVLHPHAERFIQMMRDNGVEIWD